MEIENFDHRISRSANTSSLIISSANESQRIFDEFSVNGKSKLTFDKTKALLWFVELLTLFPYRRATSRLLDRALIAADKVNSGRCI